MTAPISAVQQTVTKVPNPVMPPGHNATFETSFDREYQNIAFGKKSISQAVDDFFNDANSTMGYKS